MKRSSGLRLACVAYLSLWHGEIPAEESLVGALQQVRSSLVRVQVSGIATGTRKAEDGTAQQVRVEQTGGGSGFIFDSKGSIATNHHVVAPTGEMRWEKAPTVKVEFMGGPLDNGNRGVSSLRVPRYDAAIVGADELADLAVLRISDHQRTLAFRERDNTPHLKFADPQKIAAGENVAAIGFPRGMEGEPTATRGIISGTDRIIDNGLFSGLIQTDADINPGNSGGPLVNMQGEIVGVNTYTLGATVTADASGTISVDAPQGIYFARGAAIAKPFLEMLRDEGAIRRADLGVTYRSVTASEAQQYRLPVRGAMIVGFAAGSPAEAAGLKLGDIISGYRERNDIIPTEFQMSAAPITCVGDIHNKFAFVKPGSELLLSVHRLPQAVVMALVTGAPLNEADRQAAYDVIAGLERYHQIQVRTR